jgi:hypothetical protein
MKTFDIALEHLKDIDFSKYDVYHYDKKNPSLENESVRKQITERKTYFDSDKRNTFSNDYYRSMVYESCIYHLIDLAQGRISYWNVACDIIEAYKDLLKTKFEESEFGSEYPKIIMDRFIAYCNGLNPPPSFLNEKSEVRVEFFFSAFHYMIDKES